MIKKNHRKKPDRRTGPRRKVLLVEDWKAAYKWLSVQMALLTASAAALYEYAPTVRQWIGEVAFHHMMVVLAILTILARLKQQPKK